MGKKDLNGSGISDFKKDTFIGKSCILKAKNSLNPNNMMPSSNDQKKSKKACPNGSNQTQDNPHIEEQRQQTYVNQFDCSSIPAEGPKNSGLPGSSGQDSSGYDGNFENEHAAKKDTELSAKKDTEYLKFFRFYYDSMKNEHSNWTPSQITKIVSLLWKKKKSTQKISKGNSTNMSVTSRRSNKPMTPKNAFRMMHKGLQKKEVDQLWSKLPKESKNFWKKEGNSYCTVSAKSSDMSSMKECKNSTPVYNSMRALLHNF